MKKIDTPKNALKEAQRLADRTGDIHVIEQDGDGNLLVVERGYSENPHRVMATAHPKQNCSGIRKKLINRKKTYQALGYDAGINGRECDAVKDIPDELYDAWARGWEKGRQAYEAEQRKNKARRSVELGYSDWSLWGDSGYLQVAS
ncbi:hypothetical protein [Carnimonas bestiolae]|uniref:hypothetical protein n=1 Tax=Carnimonas bestiolae TaxID=3402172 RepID=UPI003EDBC66E